MLRKKRKTATAKRDWHFDHIVERASTEQMHRILDAFIDAVEKEGLYCGGGLHPTGGCANCKDEDEAPARKRLERQRKRQVLVEAKKLDPKEERALAEEGITGEESAWPAY